MRLAVRVKAGAHRDGLWRDGEGIYVQIRAVPEGSQANDSLIKFLAGSLRVSRGLIKLTRGQRSSHKLITIDVPDSDLKPVLDSLRPVPQASLFDDQSN